MTRRQCYFIPVDAFVEGHGYIPSLVTENEPGHVPLSGNNGASPWYWGMDYNEARKVASKANKEDWGLTEDDVLDIMASSFAASARVR